jgi:hypothetical protein
MTPTSEDRARDAAADLAACDAATPGPWVHLYKGRVYADGRKVAACDYQSHAENRQHWADAAFIALARGALPAWVRRAIAAEARVAELEKGTTSTGYDVGIDR